MHAMVIRFSPALNTRSLTLAPNDEGNYIFTTIYQKRYVHPKLHSVPSCPYFLTSQTSKLKTPRMHIPLSFSRNQKGFAALSTRQ